MNKKCKLVIKNEVVAKFEGLDVSTRRKLSEKVKFVLPYARHMPSFKMGRWDGTVRFCDIAGKTYVNLLDRLLPIVLEAGYEVEVDDHRKQHEFEFDTICPDSYSHVIWPEGHPHEGKPVTLFDHQYNAINAYLDNPQSIQVISTSAGKTIISAILADQASKYGRTIIIVPSRDLVTQTEEDFVNFGLDVGVYYGSKKEFGRTHTICTWQGLEALAKRSKKGEAEITMEDFIEGVNCVIVDETHSAKGTVLQSMLSTYFAHCPIRWGMTGTMPREDYESLGVICNLGNVVNQVKAKELQDKGILANLHINVLQYAESHVSFKDYASELKWLTTNRERLKHLASHIIEQAKEGNTLVLVDRIECGETLRDYIPDSVFISGAVKSTKRKEEYKEVNTVDNKVIIATYGVAAVGINIPRIFNLYMLEPGKSFIRVIQTIGRGIRKAKDKDFVNVFDITSTCKYSKRHLTTRKKYYAESEYEYSIKKVNY